MKYPKELALIEVKADVVRYIYQQAKYHATEHNRYADMLKEDDTEWIREQIAEHEAKNEAFKKLAETIAK